MNKYLSDLEIAQEVQMMPIKDIASEMGISEDYIDCYGKYKAKVDLSLLENTKRKNGKLILVTAINPTPAGEGKTTITIGLADAMRRLGKKSALALREPSLGPVFGIKGGAAGGGYAQVVPMEDINLHFNGDLHAITSANNLLAAMIDNHIFQGNELDIQKVVFKRCLDINDRQLRNIVNGIGIGNGITREDGFDITVATEVMAILCLSRSIDDLKERLGKIIIGFNRNGQAIYCKDLKAEGAMAALLKEAIKPNLVQSLEHTPAFIHGGPFANIAHGCNSILATRFAIKYADYAVTEAGFGADLGAEKFLDIKCRLGNIQPDAVVVVATIRALKMHGGIDKKDLSIENIDALKVGLSNLLKHVSNLKDVYNLNCVVALNRFKDDSQKEIEYLIDVCNECGVKVKLATVWSDGGNGAVELAKEVISMCDRDKNVMNFPYDLTDDIKTKILKIVTKIYGGKSVNYTKNAELQIKQLEQTGFGNMPICIAKTPYSFSDDPLKLGAPNNFSLSIKNIKVSNGAGFIVVFAGDIMTMPGLPKIPMAEKININGSGKIIGLS